MMPEINNNILTWARETSGLEVEEAARKLQIKDTKEYTSFEKLSAFESGSLKVSRPMLLKMSKLYRRPLLTFYMEIPPEKENRGQDFRTLPESIPPTDNAQVDALIRDVIGRQDILKSTLVDEDDLEPNTYIGSMSVSNTPSEIATSIVKELSFDIKEYRKARNSSEAFRYLRGLTEDIGVFVILVGNLGSHHSNIDTNIFRGFVISDEYAPFIVINDQDAKSAWSFTLIHELAHLWLGQTGISGALDDSQIEQLCDSVAGEILLPIIDMQAIDFKGHDLDGLTQNISDFAASLNVSSSMVSYRLYMMGMIDLETWKKLAGYFKQMWIQSKVQERKKNSQSNGPDYYVIKRSKLGNALVGLTERMVRTGALSTTKAAMLLGVRPIKLHKLFDNFSSMQGR